MKRKIILLFVVISFFLTLNGCSSQTGIDLSGKTFYNTVDEFGNQDHSRIWFGKDGSFVFKDNNSQGYEEFEGKWSVKENVCTLQGEGTDYERIIFEIQDENTLVLKTSLKGSRADHIFSTEEIKGSDTGSKVNAGTYANTSQSGNSLSYVEIRDDGSFTFIDRNDFSITETNGTYTVSDNMITMGNYTGNPGIGAENIIFEIKDDKTLILQNDIGISATGDIFVKDAPKEIAKKDVPCTDIKSTYNNYWSVEGSSSWNLGVTLVPADTTDKVYYSSDDENVVKVDENGNLFPQKPGKTNIHIKCGQIERTVGFETRAKGPQSIELDVGSISGPVGFTRKLNVKVTPDTADKTVTFTSDDTSVATVDENGNITAKSPGLAFITATAPNGVLARCSIFVEGEKVVFTMQNNVTVKSGSGQKIPFKAEHISCYDGVINKADVSEYVDLHSSHPSVLELDGSSNVCATGSVSETTDVSIYFTYSDGSSFNATSQSFTVRVEK